MKKYKNIGLGGQRRIWDNGKVGVFFSRSFDGQEGYDYGNYNSIAKDWNSLGYRFSTSAEARKAALVLQQKMDK